MKTVVFVLAAGFLLTASPLFAAPPLMQDGKWEISVKMEMPGLPFSMPPTTITQCITKDDVKDPKKDDPPPDKKNDCEVKDMKIQGNKADWTMQCKDGSRGSGEMVYQHNAYSGVMKMETADKKQGKSTIVQHISGRRIGDCK